MTHAATALTGVIAAAATPLTPTGQIDTATYLAHCRWLLDHGCNGLNVLGTTGEANSIALHERRALLNAVSASGLPMSQLMVGTGGCALADTIDLTRHAVHCGFAGQLILPPFYYKPVDDDGLFHFFARLIDTLADDRLQVYLYNFPQLTGIPFTIEVIQRLVHTYPGVVVGLKDSSGDVEHAKAIAAACPGFAVFPSSGAVLLSGRDHGFAGCISATVNLTSADAGRVWQASSSPDAEMLQARIAAIRNHIAAFPLVPAIKSLLGTLHDNAIWPTPLPPLMPLTPAQSKSLRQQVGITPEGAVLL
jgi:4-hydroxy-tetrahydrodipicolinate synthase